MKRQTLLRFLLLTAVLSSIGVALAGALPYAGGWNDGSRLAAVEAIGDHHTAAIDRSIFVAVPASVATLPYHRDNVALLRDGTKDKLFVNGHYYSDKTPVASIMMAGIYRVLQQVGLPAAADFPDHFCRAMTIATSGIAFIIAIVLLFNLGSHVGLPPTLKLVWLASFAFCTVAVTYTRHVNNHILLFAVTAALTLQLAKLAMEGPTAAWNTLRLALIGALVGLGYNLDLGTGPILLACTAGLIAFRYRRISAVVIVLLSAAPWLLAHHALNFAIGGVWKPANTVPEYMAWPGSPFSADNLTGFWRHGLVELIVYALALLFGKHGFVGHNLPLFLLLPAIPMLMRRRVAEWPELWFGLAWCVGTWLLYTGFSNNYGGACCSVRWFVPFLVPAYYFLAVFLREHPRYAGDFVVLSLWGGILGLIMWWKGPWITRMVPWFWQIQIAALLSWAGWCYIRRRRERHAVTIEVCAPSPQSAAA